jgi:hypothetical protein
MSFGCTLSDGPGSVLGVQATFGALIEGICAAR